MDRPIPASTYRLQLGRDLTLEGARRLVPYLARLGIGAVYLSPCLQARPGSLHGYDICDHGRISDELGGDAAFDALAREAADHGMGLVLDFVPNHVGADPASNRWWHDVLENGPCSPYARFFDIDWHPLKSELEGKLLLPILGRPYGEALESGELCLDYADGRLVLRYFDHELPLDPKQFPRVLGEGIERLQADLGEESGELREFLSVLAELKNLPAEPEPAAIAERMRERDVARERLARLVDAAARIREHVGESVRAFNGKPGKPSSFDRLHELLEAQSYRLSYWKTAFHEVNYRRFFDINDLAALRMEDPDVFAASHSFVLRLAAEGKITGLRLDHVDGLFDPRGYLARLRDEAPGLYVVIEKILTGREALRETWATEGTTGYDFLNDVNGLFVDPRAARELRRFYERFTARRAPFGIVAYVGRKLIIETTLASELTVLADALNRLSERDRRSRDFTLQSLRDALTEIVACFPVYRTYVDEEAVADFDRDVVDTAIARARRRNPAMEPSIFDFIRGVLLPAAGADEEDHERRVVFAMKFQQYTGPVQAKGLEDTAFYRYNVLLSLAEVGGDPQRFGRSPQEFHEANRHRRAHWPHAMLATTTHDTKRSEDGRARLDALSETVTEWRKAVSLWSRINGPNRTRQNGDQLPDRNDELMFYQSLLAAWPPEAARADDALVTRLVQFMEKAAKESKLHTSWINDDRTYEEALHRFVERTLHGPRTEKFLAAFLPFQRRLARLGMLNSLSQLVLKVASPGVPDFYQGTELWDLSLVDPDNRRRVDFALRERLLAEMEARFADAGESRDVRLWLAEILERWPDARIKLWVTAHGLRLRARKPALFRDGDYLELGGLGARFEHFVAFARRLEKEWIVAAVPRLTQALTDDEHPWPIGERCWQDSALRIPDDLADRELVNVLTGERLRATRGREPSLPLASVFGVFPVAMLAALS